MNITSVQSYNTNTLKKNPNFGMVLGEVTGKPCNLTRKAMQAILLETKPDFPVVDVKVTSKGFNLKTDGFIKSKPFVHEGEGLTEEGFRKAVKGLADKCSESFNTFFEPYYKTKLSPETLRFLSKNQQPIQRSFVSISNSIDGLLTTSRALKHEPDGDALRGFALDLRTRVTQFAKEQKISLDHQESPDIINSVFDDSNKIQDGNPDPLPFLKRLYFNAHTFTLSKNLGEMIELLEFEAKSSGKLSEEQQATLEFARGLKTDVDKFMEALASPPSEPFNILNLNSYPRINEEKLNRLFKKNKDLS